MSVGAKLYTQAQAAWPDIVIDGGEAAFLRHLERLLPPGTEPTSLCLEDLFLACACAQGNAAALRAFDRRYLAQVASFLASGDRMPSFVDELRQVLRDKFFVARDGAAPKIAGYSGRGSLLSWVRTATVHTARNLHRSRKTEPLQDTSQAVVAALTSGDDPELQYLQATYRQEFKDAFHSALLSLPSEQIEVIRLHYVEGLNIDRIGERLRVNRSTVARWRTAAQQTLLSDTRRQLRERLRISDSEFASLVQLVRSRLEVSLARFLGTRDEKAE